ncbi:MAG: type III pantothenate kinase [Fusicatenibacter sp.]|nr:type III pantothenate kinase [Lachnospiraceae bacterium]MDY2937805.1 type III pantothenate kinase [Fusicatenibacter sp.]
MILAIDIGNTNIVLGCVEGKKTYFIERLSTDQGKTELEYAISLKNVLELYQIPRDDLEGGIVSSVVPQLTDLVKRAAEKVIGKPVKTVGPGLKTGLNIQIDDPATVGSDLVVVAVAAMNEYPLPQIIIDMGTATTMSVVNQKGTFIGGAVLPGVRISLDALASNCAMLNQLQLKAPKKIIGRNTNDCMRSGIINGNAACIDGMIERMEEEMGCECTVVATGGLSSVVIPCCKKKIILDEDLLLKGLQIIYEKNR